MVFDYSDLLGEIVKRYGTQINFAVILGLSERSLSLKLNGKVEWKQSEMYKIVELLGEDKESIPRYFFCYKGSKKLKKLAV